jgi:hypothetical protein
MNTEEIALEVLDEGIEDSEVVGKCCAAGANQARA